MRSLSSVFIFIYSRTFENTGKRDVRACKSAKLKLLNLFLYSNFNLKNMRFSFQFDCRSKCLVGCFGFSGPLRQYCSLYRAVSQREGERGERIDENKMSKLPPPAPTASAIGPCPTVIKIVGRLGTGSLPSTIAPPDRPRVWMFNLTK